MRHSAHAGRILVPHRRHPLGAFDSYSLLLRGDILSTRWHCGVAPQVPHTRDNYAVWLAHSDDDGATWSAARPLDGLVVDDPASDTRVLFSHACPVGGVAFTLGSR